LTGVLGILRGLSHTDFSGAQGVLDGLRYMTTFGVLGVGLSYTEFFVVLGIMGNLETLLVEACDAWSTLSILILLLTGLSIGLGELVGTACVDVGVGSFRVEGTLQIAELFEEVTGVLLGAFAALKGGGGKPVTLDLKRRVADLADWLASEIDERDA
jgi:hypothetical protein